MFSLGGAAVLWNLQKSLSDYIRDMTPQKYSKVQVFGPRVAQVFAMKYGSPGFIGPPLTLLIDIAVYKVGGPAIE